MVNGISKNPSPALNFISLSFFIHYSLIVNAHSSTPVLNLYQHRGL